MNHSLRAFLFSAASLLALPAVTVTLRADPTPFPTTTVTVDGTQYTLTYDLAQSFDSIASTLESQAWWGNEALADALAVAVGASLADYNFNDQSPYFAFEADNGVFEGAFTYSYSPNSNPQTMVAPIDGWAGRWAVVVPTSTSSVPDSSSTLGLTVLSLTTLGFASWRRKRTAA